MAQQGVQMQPMNTLESIQSRLNTLNARATAAGQIVGNAGRFPELVQNLERITAALKTKVSEVSRTLAGINIPEVSAEMGNLNALADTMEAQLRELSGLLPGAYPPAVPAATASAAPQGGPQVGGPPPGFAGGFVWDKSKSKRRSKTRSRRNKKAKKSSKSRSKRRR